MDRPEQDQEGGDDLPTYDDLAEKNGPNSRFGRWKGWIEKRAAERYADVTPDELRRRRERGWGNPDTAQIAQEVQEVQQLNVPIILNQPPTPSASSIQAGGPSLHLQTSFNGPFPLLSPPLYPEEDEEPHPLIGQLLAPTHLTFNEFGSRFLPHTTAPIRTLLPLLGDKLLLIGHDDGLSVLNMFPQEWGEYGLRNKGPSEAEAHRIWEGEGVYQLTILEVEDTGESTPQGVLLALVGPEPEHDQEPVRTLRMYNLASIISLAKWAISQKGAKPVDLRRPATWHPQQTPPKKHRPQSSLAKGLKSLVLDSSPHRDHHTPEPSSSSYQKMLSPSSPSPQPPLPLQKRSSSGDSGWDMVDDLPLRWATDYVPLASASSRLLHTSVLSYALWHDDRRVRGSALLAVTTKSCILLYEAPKGERAFRFVKEFYTPMTPRSVTFVLQNAPESISRSPSDATMNSSRPLISPQNHARVPSGGSYRRGRNNSTTQRAFVFGNQLSLFIVFEKKAGMIRLSDSAVGEVELCDPNLTLSRDTLPLPATGSTSSGRRSRASYDGFAVSKDTKGLWSPPARVDLPLVAGRYDVSQPVYILTRGKKTHILPCPLPVNMQFVPPLKVLTWNSHPTYVSPRVMQPESREGVPSLQLIAFSEDGLEVQEISLSFLSDRKEKGRAEEPLRSQTDFGGDMGHLCAGGLWHKPYDAPLSRSYSTSSGYSTQSWDSMDTEEITARIQGEQGVYGWQRRGLEDYRVFWVGGLGAGNSQEFMD